MKEMMESARQVMNGSNFMLSQSSAELALTRPLAK
jgi:hypothetical protein